MLVLGDEIPIFSSIKNMNAAYNSLKSKDNDYPDYKIKTTHLYLRFLPKDENELDILREDSTRIWYEYPMHFKIAKKGSYYHDPNLPDNQITWQYVVLSIENEIPDIKHEIIAELCINKEKEMKNNNQNCEFFDCLLNEAKRLSDHKDKNNLKSTNASWIPSGNLKVDGKPIEGIEVRAKNGLHVETGYTDYKGDFTVGGTFTSDVEYSVNWERYQFSIRAGYDGKQAIFVAPSETYDEWKVTLNSSGWDRYYARIFRGAHHYYYKNISGLNRPPQNSFWESKIKINACNGTNDGGTFNSNTITGKIYIYELSTNLSCDVFGTVIHELTHGAHWDYNKSLFHNDIPIEMKEKWAVGIQWYITRYFEDASYLPNYHGVYTDLVQDLNDMYYGYSVLEIQTGLLGQTTWQGWRNSLKSYYPTHPRINLVDGIFDAHF